MDSLFPIQCAVETRLEASHNGLGWRIKTIVMHNEDSLLTIYSITATDLQHVYLGNSKSHDVGNAFDVDVGNKMVDTRYTLILDQDHKKIDPSQ